MTAITSVRKLTADNFPALLKLSNPSLAEIALVFRKLHHLVESLPLTTDQFCFGHNWLCSAEQLWESGDHHAARYQVNQLVKKLKL
ncbi:MAG: hypothetical protein ACJ8FY_01960 [Gemmataceae bacterium]